jgi:hypothetical protein
MGMGDGEHWPRGKNDSIFFTSVIHIIGQYYYLISNMSREEETTTKSVSIAEDVAEKTTVAKKALEMRRLSTISRRYDRDGKGYLDETEQALRRMDTQNQGFLGMDKIYGIVEELHSQEQRNSALIEDLRTEAKANSSLRKGIFLLCIFTVFLTISNIGTSLAAARLAKDTQVSYYNDLQSSSSGVRLGTTPKDVMVQMNPVSEELRMRRSRHLQAASDLMCPNVTAANAAIHNSTILCELSGTMGSAEAERLYELFCPGYKTSGYCTGNGVSKINLNCHGHLSTLFGGSQLPPTPPVSFDGMTAYPTSGMGYVGEAAVFLFGRLIPCIQEFSVGLYCPDEPVVMDNGELNDDCMMFLSWEPGTCLGRVELCGQPTDSSV